MESKTKTYKNGNFLPLDFIRELKPIYQRLGV